MKSTPIDIIEPYISEKFVKQSIPPKPIIAIHAREQRDSMNIIKSFYLKYPQFRWFAFRDMRGLTEEQFAETFQECFLSVWIDPISSFGTFPLESMKSGVPVIGKIPNMVPSWMNENNGIWVQEQNRIVDFIADFIQNWLEDNISETLYQSMEETSSKFSSKENFQNSVIENFENYYRIRIEMLEEQLNKLQTV
jgi:glycosyltransferase involved in cell wall biosynthesis